MSFRKTDKISYSLFYSHLGKRYQRCAYRTQGKYVKYSAQRRADVFKSRVQSNSLKIEIQKQRQTNFSSKPQLYLVKKLRVGCTSLLSIQCSADQRTIWVNNIRFYLISYGNESVNVYIYVGRISLFILVKLYLWEKLFVFMKVQLYMCIIAICALQSNILFIHNIERLTL